MPVGVAPFLIPALWNIDILHYKQAKLPKHLQHSVLHMNTITYGLALQNPRWTWIFKD